MRLLVIGGTVFVGRAVVEEALARGHEVTVFHRGAHGAELFGGSVERVLGDRREGLAGVADREWDLVVDTCAFAPSDIHPVDAERYSLVSTIGVYRDWPLRPVTEQSPTWTEGGGAYEQGKADAERALEALLPGRVLHARAGVIVGPHENIGRLPYWLRRMARGGEVLAPGPRDATLQLIDVRDLATVLLDGEPGRRNVVAPPGQATWGELLELCARGTEAQLAWVDGAAAAARVGDPWSELPLWPAPLADMAAVYAAESAVATRPLAETVEDTRAWLDAGGELSDWRREVAATGLSAGAEAELLASLPRV